MSSIQAGEFKLEVVVLPVSDVDRAKEFYKGLGWRLDADAAGDGDLHLVRGDYGDTGLTNHSETKKEHTSAR